MPSGSANISSDGIVTQLDRKSEPDEVLQETEVTVPEKLVRRLTRMLRDITTLKRRWMPRRIDYVDQTVDGAGTTFLLQHNFGGRVRWWVVEYQISGAAGSPIIQNILTSTDSNTLALASYKAGVVTIRVEEAGG